MMVVRKGERRVEDEEARGFRVSIIRRASVGYIRVGEA